MTKRCSVTGCKKVAKYGELCKNHACRCDIGKYPSKAKFDEGLQRNVGQNYNGCLVHKEG